MANVPEGESYTQVPTSSPREEEEAKALYDVTLELHYVSNHPEVALEKASVWGTAVVLPQVARSSGWNPTFVMLALRVYINYIICITISMGLITYIGEETHIMNPLGGQMHLCDFGANIDACPDGDHCVGPGGTRFTPTRMYGYTQWAIQKFVKQALLDVVPDQEDLINAKVDPGEWGVENKYCRLSVVLCFFMSMVPEVGSIVEYVRVIMRLPTQNESWIRFSNLDSAKTGEEVNPWEKVSFQVSGIPLFWKAFYFVVLVIPRIAIIHFVLFEGTQLLMETAGITDSVMSAVSMSFIADIGGMVFRCLAPRPVPQIMSRLKQAPQIQEERRNPPLWCLIIPGKVVVLFGMTFLYVWNYYREKCTQTADGTWVSHDMYTPQSTSYTLTNLLLHNIAYLNEPFWSMPSEE